MKLQLIFQIVLLTAVGLECKAASSPIPTFTTYDNYTELERNACDLWWTVRKTEIIFELHMATTGWIALGISKTGGMSDADIGVGWVAQTGTVHFQDRYSYRRALPAIDDSIDWFALQGRELDGWTSIQFRRLLNTMDSLDVPISPGISKVIYAYGLVDVDETRPDGDITYHANRRGNVSITLVSSAAPSSNRKSIDMNLVYLMSYLVVTLMTINIG